MFLTDREGGTTNDGEAAGPDIEVLVGHFETLEDPRSEVNLLHPLRSVIVIAIMAILAGANGPTAIARWVNAKADLLLKHFKLPQGIPQKGAFQACFTLFRNTW